jgi:gamma-glutamyltranspeptidase/glutathione hydrolase
MVTSSHHLAAEAGLRVLREGGNAIEAMVAAAATISVVYPHMNGLGGDGFWLISEPAARVPRAINAVGAAGAGVDVDLYRRQGLAQIPTRGPLAANTVAGTISGWQAALEVSAAWGGSMPLARLLEDALHYADAGFPVSDSQYHNTVAKRAELADVPGWADTFLSAGEPPVPGALYKQPALATTLRRLAQAGLDDFYRGELARSIGADLERAGSPVVAGDYERQRALGTDPLSVRLQCGTAYNVTPPAQGIASLIILGIFDRLGCGEADGFEHVHGVVEATKQAILLRNAHCTDPAYMEIDPRSLLTNESLDSLAGKIDPSRATPWPRDAKPGDTVWLGAVDDAGRAVSFIHSIYWEFGSGVVLRDTGIQCQNRGSSFSLDQEEQNCLRPGRLPFHTNNPAMALFNDGRVMVYGAMGGEGQPQTQAALFTRYAMLGAELQHAITAPRWVLSRTWGETRTDLRLESRFPRQLIDELRDAGHDVNTVDDFDEVMGHAGAIVLHPSGLMEGASDPRSCGAVSAF